MLEPITRKEFDSILQDIFPQAIPYREERKHGWVDTIDINVIKIQIEAYTVKWRRIPTGSFVIWLKGVRTSLDGSDVPLWRYQCEGLDKLRDGLLVLRKRILGIAAALLYITDCSDALPTPALGPDGKRTPPINLDDFFSN